MQVDFELQGSTALLMHSDDIENGDIVKQWQNDPKNKDVSVKGDDRSPAWTWQSYLYTSAESIVMPSANLMACLRSAGARMILKGNKTYKEATQAGLGCLTEDCALLVDGKEVSLLEIAKIREKTFVEQCEAVRKLGFRLWAKRARVGQAKHVRVRPRFDSWSVTGSLIVYETDILKKDILVQLFEIAGNLGLGDWRPGCKTPGMFGKFQSQLKFH